MRRVAVTFALLLTTMPICNGPTIELQAPAEVLIPVSIVPGPGPRTEDIRLDGFEFNQPVIGRHGLDFSRIDGEPSRGAQYFVEAKLYSQQAILTAKFEAVDETGKVILLIRIGRVASVTGDADFYGLMRVPDKPFRVMVSGKGVDGESYSRVYERLFRPTNRRSDTLLPTGAKGELATRGKEMVKARYRKLAAEVEHQYPNGVLVLPRTHVSNVA